ncbi:hypothetical protein QX249_09600 [Vibrio parahaemolyticus]|uniref:Uncharacterized protein n=1 Tax=Vibrio parahaemolyticus TaxID=670 RepID=A0AAW8PYJ4_VIBPH|nr:hypothetical protein [Vibrio parahaemolyticus]MDS1820910.1 hypothetical protein [Vibrio parahaemolyticus]
MQSPCTRVSPNPQRKDYWYVAPHCKGFVSLKEPIKQPLPIDYHYCKERAPSRVCNSELKIFCHSKGRDEPYMLSFKHGNLIEFSDAESAYNLLTVSKTNAIGVVMESSLINEFFKLGFELSSLCFSIKKKGQFSHCYFDKTHSDRKPYPNEVRVFGNEYSLESSVSDFRDKLGVKIEEPPVEVVLGKNRPKADGALIQSLFTSFTGKRLLKQLSELGFDLSTLYLSATKVLID